MGEPKRWTLKGERMVTSQGISRRVSSAIHGEIPNDASIRVREDVVCNSDNERMKAVLDGDEVLINALWLAHSRSEMRRRLEAARTSGLAAVFGEKED